MVYRNAVFFQNVAKTLLLPKPYINNSFRAYKWTTKKHKKTDLSKIVKNHQITSQI